MSEEENSRWKVGLTPREEALAMSIGFARQYPFFGNPEANRRFDEGAIWEAHQHAVTAGAEIAWSKMFLGTYENFIPSVNTFKQEPDVGDWEVRYKFTRGNSVTPTLRLSSKIDNDRAPYVLLVGGPETKIQRKKDNGYQTPPYEALGWCYPYQVMISDYISGYEGGKPTYSIPVSALRSMVELESPPSS